MPRLHKWMPVLPVLLALASVPVLSATGALDRSSGPAKPMVVEIRGYCEGPVQIQLQAVPGGTLSGGGAAPAIDLHGPTAVQLSSGSMLVISQHCPPAK